MSMTLIQHIELGSNQSSITFSSIPATFTDLVLKVSPRNTSANTERDIFLQFNGDTTSGNYQVRRLYGDGGNAYSDAFSSGADALRIGFASGTNQTANTFGSVEIYIPNYTRNAAKSISADAVTENNATRAMQQISAGLWTGTAAISSITLQMILSVQFAANSSATLYGITAGSSGGVTVS
jgi:hypothetical protein